MKKDAGGEEGAFSEAFVVVLRTLTTALVGFDCAGANDADQGFIAMDLLYLLLRQATTWFCDGSVCAVKRTAHPPLVFLKEESDWFVDGVELGVFFDEGKVVDCFYV
jgi:hypothetical protein